MTPEDLQFMGALSGLLSGFALWLPIMMVW